MLRKTALILFVIAAASMVHAEGGYVGSAINYTNLKDADDGGLSVEVLGGMQLGKAMRGELALAFDREDFGNEKVRIWTAFANAYYDFKLESKLNPYILGGLGYGSASTGDIFSSSSRSGGFLGQVGAGIAFPLSEQLLLDLKYRYQMSDDYTLKGKSFKLTAHQIGVGFRYLF